MHSLPAHPPLLPMRALSHPLDLTFHEGEKLMKERSTNLGKILIRRILGGLILVFCLLG